MREFAILYCIIRRKATGRDPASVREWMIGTMAVWLIPTAGTMALLNWIFL